MKQLSKRMRRSLLSLMLGDNLVVGNYRRQNPNTYVPSNTFNALQRRGFVDCFFRDGVTKLAFITDEGREQLVEAEYGVDDGMKT